ncbi:nucleotidyltransferase [Sphingobacteriaceae bacterium]|nr:nucleotidyltransferase [Sphingobacteriaceae bacterium]
MAQRIVIIWFPHLMTDWLLRRKPQLKTETFALALLERNRRVIKAVNKNAQERGIYTEMVVADCKALVPELQVYDYDPDQPLKLLSALAEWCIRFTPVVSLELPDSLILDADGCTHLWGGETEYINDIYKRFSDFGYTTRISIADTIGSAWAVCRFEQTALAVKPNDQVKAIEDLPPAALRLETATLDKLAKLGFLTIKSFMNMPRAALRRRFGQNLLKRLDQALGAEMELINPIQPISPYQERLPSLEPICTAAGIEIALKNLLETLCLRLNRESKGLRIAELKCYRIDGTIQSIGIGTNRPSRNVMHLFKLFEIRISEIQPDLGIELFVLEAGIVEELLSSQDALWSVSNSNESSIAELLDRLEGKTGAGSIHRYLPAEHYWPEYSIKQACSLVEEPTTAWRTDLPRPLHLLSVPEQIEVSVPIPDYPPLLFIYKGLRHTVKKADGPERIEQEWWTQTGAYRDYYCVEDEKGARYWVFRSGDYRSESVKWFLHGFFS